MADQSEIDELERTAAWRLRLVDADPDDHVSRTAAVRLQVLADELSRGDLDSLWTELGALRNWLGESGLISDYADLASDYRSRIGVTDMPSDAADYLRALIAMAQGLV